MFCDAMLAKEYGFIVPVCLSTYNPLSLRKKLTQVNAISTVLLTILSSSAGDYHYVSHSIKPLSLPGFNAQLNKTG
jgi:hypothetical protein